MTGRVPRRRILLVTNLLGRAGAEKQLEHLAIGLAAAGHSVVLLAIGGKYADVAPLEQAGVEVVALGAEGRAGKLRALRPLVRFARAAEVVHCTGWDATLWGRLAAALARRPALITEHTPGREAQVASADGSAGVGTIALHNRLLDHFTYAVIVVGDWQRRLLESEGVSAQSIVHIPNGVPVAALRRRAEAGPDREALGIPAAAPVIVQVARFAPQKGQGAMLRIAAGLRQRFGDLRLLLAGGGETEAQLREEVAALGAEDWVTFLGFRDDVPGIVRLADLSVLPSLGEGLPMSLLESAAVGTPIVATDVGDVRWFLESSGAGLCVPVGDEEAFAGACAELLDDPERRRAVGAAAERAAAASFDAGTMVRRYEEVIEAAAVKAPLPLRLSV